MKFLANKYIYLFIGFFLLFFIMLECDLEFKIWFRILAAGVVIYCAGFIEGME